MQAITDTACATILIILYYIIILIIKLSSSPNIDKFLTICRITLFFNTFSPSPTPTSNSQIIPIPTLFSAQIRIPSINHQIAPYFILNLLPLTSSPNKKSLEKQRIFTTTAYMPLQYTELRFFRSYFNLSFYPLIQTKPLYSYRFSRFYMQTLFPISLPRNIHRTFLILYCFLSQTTRFNISLILL